jgi:hypothetical protein
MPATRRAAHLSATTSNTAKAKSNKNKLVLSAAQKALWLIPYNEREKFKSEAWAIYNDEKVDIPGKALAILRVSEMHYHRMIEDLSVEMQRLVIGSKPPGYILELDTYTNHWLAANHQLFTPEVGQYILDEFHYKPERCKYMPSGRSSYSTAHVGKPFDDGFGLRRTSNNSIPKSKGRPMIEFFKNGDALAIRTDAQTENEFFDGLADAIQQMSNGEMKNDLEYHLRFWLPQAFEILCKLRGYKADVQEKRILMAGARFVPELPALRVGREGEVPTEKEAARSQTA